MKKLVFVNQTLGIGGAEIFNLGLLDYLNYHEFKVSAFTTNFDFQKQLQAENIETQHIPLVIDIIGDWKGLAKGILLMPIGICYYAALTLSKPKGIFLMTGFIEKILLTPWAKLAGSKVIWIEFGPLQTVLEKFWGFPGFLYKLVSWMPDKVIMSSLHTKAANAKYFKKPIQIIPCAINARTINVKSDPKLLVCVSRLEPGKGQDLLIDAWAEVIKKVPSAKLKIIGEGDRYESLKTQVSRLKLTASIELAGWVEDAVAEMAKSAVVVFPSVWPLEGFGIAAVEAMSQGKPVVGFNRGPLPEIVDKNTGILVPPGDTTKLAEAIIYLLKNPTNMGRKGLEKYNRLFTWKAVGPQYEMALG